MKPYTDAQVHRIQREFADAMDDIRGSRTGAAIDAYIEFKIEHMDARHARQAERITELEESLSSTRAELTKVYVDLENMSSEYAELQRANKQLADEAEARADADEEEEGPTALRRYKVLLVVKGTSTQAKKEVLERLQNVAIISIAAFGHPETHVKAWVPSLEALAQWFNEYGAPPYKSGTLLFYHLLNT